jgi:rubredoxin
MKTLKKMMCNKHELIFVRNIYGDEINKISPANKTYRSEWKCSKCGKIKYKEYLNKRER